MPLAMLTARVKAFTAAGCQRRPARRSCTVVRAEALRIPSQFSKVTPKGQYVLVKVAEQETKTLGGILLPTSAQRRPTSGQVVAVGDGNLPDGTQHTFVLSENDTVLYSKFGFTYTELQVQNDEFILIREEDVIGIMPRSDAVADDIPELKPVGDRVLIKVEEAADVTSGGVLLPDAAKERPLSGTVVRVGGGKKQEDGTIKPIKVKEGDKVIYFKYAGDNMETSDGRKYVVVHENDILCKA